MAYQPILNPQPVKVEPTTQDLLVEILIELQTMNTMLQIGLSIPDEPENIRASFASIY